MPMHSLRKAVLTVKHFVGLRSFSLTDLPLMDLFVYTPPFALRLAPLFTNF